MARVGSLDYLSGLTGPPKKRKPKKRTPGRSQRPGAPGSPVAGPPTPRSIRRKRARSVVRRIAAGETLPQPEGGFGLPKPRRMAELFARLEPAERKRLGPKVVRAYESSGTRPPETLRRYAPKSFARASRIHREGEREKRTDQGSDLVRALEAAALLVPGGALVRGAASATKLATAAAKSGRAASSAAGRTATRARTATRSAAQRASASRAARQATTARPARRLAAKATRGRVKAPPRGAKARTPGRLATHPAAAAAATGGPVAGVGGALVQGHLEADPGESLATTSRVIPASIGFLADVFASTGATGVRAARTGLAEAGLPGGRRFSGDEITGPVRGVAKQLPALAEGLAPLVSGDPEQVREAVESDIGYAFVPLAPRGAISAPARAAGRGAKAAERAAGRGASAAGRAARRPFESRRAEPTPRPTEPGLLREVRQRAGPQGREIRRGVSEQAGHEIQPERAISGRRRRDVERSISRIEGAPNRKDAAHLVGMLADYGVRPGSRGGDPLAAVRIIRRDIEEAVEAAGGERIHQDLSRPEGTITTTSAVKIAERNPALLSHPRLWEAVDNYKAGAKELETSPVAKYREQARVRGVSAPEKRVPMRAREFTGATTREGAHADLKAQRARVAKLKGEARKAIKEAQIADARAKGTPMQGKQRLTAGTKASTARARAAQLRAQAKALEARAHGLARGLRGYTHPDTKPSAALKSKGWDSQLVGEFLDELAAPARLWEEPAWVHHASLAHILDGEIPGARFTPSQVQHIKTGAAEIADSVDRSWDALARGSIHTPRLRLGIARFTRQFFADPRWTRTVRIGGKERRSVTRDEWNRAVREQQIDPREWVPVPAARWRRAFEAKKFDPQAEPFDLAKFHHEASAELLRPFEAEAARQARGLQGRSKTRYTPVRREAMREYLDQINPRGTGLERVLSGLSVQVQRTVLFSPAWAMIQVGAEGLQMLAAVSSPLRLGRAIHGLREAARKDRRGYEGFVSTAGESVASFDQPHVLRAGMDAGTHGQFVRGFGAIRNTLVGKALIAIGTRRIFGLFDRWKGGKYRSIVQAAEVDRNLNGFFTNLGRAARVEERISKQLAGKPLSEQIAWLGRNRRELEPHAQYMRDVMGDFHSFTRYERQFGPLAMFYSFIRMSFRWTFWTYPRHHPIKAEIGYFLAQQHAETMEKLLGAKPDWIRYGDPLTFDEDGNPTGTIPIGHRLVPGLNSILEAVGDGQIEGVGRAVNPLLSTPVYTLFGLDPFSGEQKYGTAEQKGLLALRQLVSMFPPARLFDAGRIGRPETSPGERFEELDPLRLIRANVFPFLPLRAESAREINELGKLLDTLADKPEFGEVLDAARRGDTNELREIAERLQLSAEAGDRLEELVPDTPAEERDLERASEIYYRARERSEASEAVAPWRDQSSAPPAPWKSPAEKAPTAPWRQ